MTIDHIIDEDPNSIKIHEAQNHRNNLDPVLGWGSRSMCVILYLLRANIHFVYFYIPMPPQPTHTLNVHA